jgi:diguanylate cyclase (GGDEF)-like protein
VSETVDSMPIQQGTTLTVFLGLALLYLVLCPLNWKFNAISTFEKRANRLTSLFLLTQSAWYLAFYGTLVYSGEGRFFPTLQDALGFLSYCVTVPMIYAFANQTPPKSSWLMIAATLLLAVPITILVPGYINKLHVGNLAILAMIIVNLRAIRVYLSIAQNAAVRALWYITVSCAFLLCSRSVALLIDPGMAVWNEAFLSFLLPLISISVTILMLGSIVLTAQKSLTKLAMRDQLTGLRNRYALMQDFQALLGRHKRGQQSFALLVADIDYFKSINDQYGHDVGDKVLKRVASCLQDTIRQGDIAARLGGEEFVILAYESDLASLEHMCERVVEQVRRLDLADIDTDLKVTISVGGVLVKGTFSEFEQVFQLADQQLYAAKNSGRDRFLVSDETELQKPSKHLIP